MPAGDFSATQLTAITLKAQEMWAKNPGQTPPPNVATVNAVKANQNARLADLEEKDKDKQVKITWVNSCALAVSDCTPDCEITGPELESDAVTYDLDLCKEVRFSVNETKLRTNTLTFDELAAPGLSAAIASLDNWYNSQMLLHLKTFAGVNGIPAPWTYAAGTTTIPAASYNRSIVANVIYQAMRNGFTNPFFINNGDLYVDWLNAQLDARNAAGAGDAARVAELSRMTFDLQGFFTAGLTESLFMVNPGAVAMATKARNPNVPKIMKDVTLYTVPSRAIPGVVYDAFYQLTCSVNGTESEYIHSWKLKTRGGIFLNPNQCPITIGGTTVTPTGVISYTKGA